MSSQMPRVSLSPTDAAALIRRLIPLTQVRLYVVAGFCCRSDFSRADAPDDVPIARRRAVGGEAEHGFERDVPVKPAIAGAGGAMLALAADLVYAMSGVVLNPHYRSMGELYGSEYWTYTLPRRVGQRRALELTQSCQPLGARAACDI